MTAKTGGQRLGILMSSIIIAIYGIFTALFFILHAAGLQKFVVTSGSMFPALPVGSCICVKEKTAEQIQEGEIITFYLEGMKTAVTHRVIENDPANECFYTKGDANEIPDGSPVSYGNTIGTVRLVLPFVGYLLVFLNTFKGKIAAVSLFIACILIQCLIERKNNA